MIPAIHGYLNEIYVMSIILVFATMISANYWKNAIRSWERILDRIYAKLAFSFFFYNSFFYVRQPSLIIIGYGAIPFSWYCYYMSNCVKCKTWWKYHFAFHVFATIQQWVVIESMIQQQKTIKS